jgi:hypothetical protein
MISSVVQDSQGGVVPNARITLTNQAQGAVVRELDTSMEGTFVITPVPPGTYTLTIEATGFKKWIKQDITLFANDRIAIPPIILEVGTSNETVTVEAGTVQIQTVSADRSAVLTEKQMLNLALATRDWTGLLRTMAGTIADPTGGTALPNWLKNSPRLCLRPASTWSDTTAYWLPPPLGGRMSFLNRISPIPPLTPTVPQESSSSLLMPETHRKTAPAGPEIIPGQS